MPWIKEKAANHTDTVIIFTSTENIGKHFDSFGYFRISVDFSFFPHPGGHDPGDLDSFVPIK